MTYRVSVVVPTYKRLDLLQRCLHALLTQDFALEAYEIIVVDDANDENLRQLFVQWQQEAYARNQTLRYIPVRSKQHGPAIARNLGWQAARGEIIAFTDDDCIPLTNWLTMGVCAFSSNVMAVSGHVIVPLPDIPSDYEYSASHLETSLFVTANCFYRRSTLLELGGFDERFTLAWREDSDLFFTLLERNMAWRRAPEAKVLHPIRQAPWGVSIKQQRKSMFNALLYKKHPLLYRQHIQKNPPWHYYMLLAALLVGIIGLGCKSKFLSISGFGLWTWLTTHFCIQRLQHTSRTPMHVMEMIITSLIIPPLAIYWRLAGMVKFRVPFL